MFYEKRTKLKLLLIPILLVILVAIFLSLTRSVWVGIFIALAIFIIYYKPKILYAAIPVAALLFVLPPNSVTNRVTSIFDMNNATNKDRFYMYRTGMKIFKDYPVTGVGPDNVAKIYDNYKPAEAVHSNPHLHNNFLHILAERGILTLGALVAAFFSIIFLLVSKIKQSIGFEKTVSLGVLFAFIGFLVAGLFEFNFGDTEMKFLLFFFISIPFLKFPAHKMDTADVPVHPQMEPEAKGIPDKKNQPNGDSQETSGPSPAPGGAA
ncbi:MAG: O-antigen ligase family protein [bacterium]|nr:O-antigen ligase family protein [bacterium]